MADQLNVDVVNIRDVTLFTNETDLSTVEFYSRKGAVNKKFDGGNIPNEVVDKADLGTFTGTTISDNRDIKEALQELETAVEAASGTSYTNIDLGKLQAIGVSGAVAYAGAAGSGIITVTDAWSMFKGDLYIDIASDTDGSNNFDLTLTVTNGTYNTWDGTGTHDLFVPQIQVFDAGPTALTLKQATNVTLGNSQVIAPNITWGTNSVTYHFLGSTDFGSLSRVLVTIKP